MLGNPTIICGRYIHSCRRVSPSYAGEKKDPKPAYTAHINVSRSNIFFKNQPKIMAKLVKDFSIATPNMTFNMVDG